MIIPSEMLEEVDKKFRVVYGYKEEAKIANKTATETLNDLADLLDKEKTKASKKHWKRVVKKAWKEWFDRNTGDNSTDDASVLVTQMLSGEGS